MLSERLKIEFAFSAGLKAIHAMELSRDSGAKCISPRFGKVMMTNLTWPDRIVFGHAQGAI